MEFALLAPMLIALLFGTVEIGVMEMMSTNLDAAVLVAARMIRTGDANRATTASGFVSQVCANMSDSLANCTARLAVSVSTFSSFASVQQAATSAPDGSFNGGGPGDIILVKATYAWPLILPFYSGGFQSQGPTKAILSTSTTFKNEPYA
jgi:Flp pilus assembly protein TadG